jgi:hypothetical protein
MKFEELEVGKKYQIDGMGTVGTLQEGAGFEIEKPHGYFEDKDGLVRFAPYDDFEYKEIKED